jgi:hypothetical protein
MYAYMNISVKAPKQAHSLTELESTISRMSQLGRVPDGLRIAPVSERLSPLRASAAGTPPAFAFAHGGKTHSPQHGRLTIIIEGVNFAPVGKRRTGLEGSTPCPLDDLERKMTCAQGGHDEPAPLVRRVGLVVAPAAERH